MKQVMRKISAFDTNQVCSYMAMTQSILCDPVCIRHTFEKCVSDTL